MYILFYILFNIIITISSILFLGLLSKKGFLDQKDLLGEDGLIGLTVLFGLAGGVFILPLVLVGTITYFSGNLIQKYFSKWYIEFSTSKLSPGLTHKDNVSYRESAIER